MTTRNAANVHCGRNKSKGTVMFSMQSTKLATMFLEARRRCFIQPLWINDARIPARQRKQL